MSGERLLLAPVEARCRAARLVVLDGNRTVQLALPCGTRAPGGRASRHGGTSQRRELSLYTSQSDNIAVYLQPPFNAVANAPRHRTHHLYLIKYQGSPADRREFLLRPSNYRVN